MTEDERQERNRKYREWTHRTGRNTPRKPAKTEEEKRKTKQEYRKNNRERINKYYRERRKNDPQYCMKRRLRRRADKCITNRTLSHNKLLGCSGTEYVKYLEKLFTDGMTWENKGKWEIDHIVPLSTFDLTREEEQLKAFHYSNTQPLWRSDNMAKGNKCL